MRYKQLLLAITFLAFVVLGIHSITKTDNKLKLKNIQLQSTQADLINTELKFQKLNVELDSQLKSKVQDQNKIKQLEEEKKKLQDHTEELQKQVRAKQEQKLAEAEKIQQVASITATVQASAGCNTGNQYKDYIYSHESGCNPASVNSIGCRGIGQACPGSKLPCSADFACQDAYFTTYAMNRYGSWENAYNFWTANHWW
jgi:hypothetical protein